MCALRWGFKCGCIEESIKLELTTATYFTHKNSFAIKETDVGKHFYCPKLYNRLVHRKNVSK